MCGHHTAVCAATLRTCSTNPTLARLSRCATAPWSMLCRLHHSRCSGGLCAAPEAHGCSLYSLWQVGIMLCVAEMVSLSLQPCRLTHLTSTSQPCDGHRIPSCLSRSACHVRAGAGNGTNDSLLLVHAHCTQAAQARRSSPLGMLGPSPERWRMHSQGPVPC